MDNESGHSVCSKLFGAGKALLVASGLVCWDDQTLAFAPKYPGDDDAEFEDWWKENFHPEFGRYMAWVFLSVGSENLVKAACICNGVVVVKKNPDKLGAMGKYKAKLPELCACRSISFENKSVLTSSYDRLLCIRNRDAHSYLEDKRRIDFPYVKPKFVPAFNILAGTMDRCQTLCEE